MARIYIAGCLERRAEAEGLATRLRAAGHEVTSQWHRDPMAVREIEHRLAITDRSRIARTNFDDLDRAEVIVLLADPRCRGSLVEMGYAMAKPAKDCVAIGDRLAASLMLTNCVWAEDADAFVAMASGWGSRS